MKPILCDMVFKHSPYIPYDPTVNPVYTGYTTHPALGGVQPFVYTNWREEELSWHENCYIHAGLNPINETKITGKDAAKFLSRVLTNNFDTYPIGKIKHAIAVNENGHLMTDGIILRIAEDHFEGTNLSPYLDFKATTFNDLDVKVEDITGDYFTFQLGGPKSLEIVEAATKENFHDLEFLYSRNSQIDGADVRIMRIGMAGALAYEVHGTFEDSVNVYTAIIEAGKKYDLTKLGRHAYWNTHTENGFPQAIIHFPYASEEDQAYWKYLLDTNSSWLAFAASTTKMAGSMGDDYTKRFVNPFELGWGSSVSFKHDFIGKEALQKIKEEGYREYVTLEWDLEDILDVYRSELQPGTPYAKIEGPEDYDESGHYEYRADQVLVDGKVVGTSTGRIHSWYYRKMISLGLLEKDAIEMGKTVTILWGSNGERQKEIKATIARYPYNDENRNEGLDVANIPSGC